MDNALCVRCLIQVSATTTIAARWKHINSQIAEVCETPNDPKALKKWVEDHVYGYNARISTNDAIDTFVPFATWCGDPICVVHLWEMVDAERLARMRH